MEKCIRLNDCLNINKISIKSDIKTEGIFNCRSFHDLLECSINYQGVASAPVQPVWKGGGTHDSRGIFPRCARPLFNRASFTGRQWEGESKRRGGDTEMSEPATNPAATSFPAPTLSLPLGVEVLRTYSGVLVCLEIVSDVHVKSFT